MSSLLYSSKNARFLPGSDRFIRSGKLSSMTERDILFFRETGVTRAIDLREEHERLEDRSVMEFNRNIEYLVRPVTGGNTIPSSCDEVVDSYLRMVDDKMKEIVELIETAPRKAVFFCNAGKDRTGVVAALVLKRMGADEETIIGDYMKSEDELFDELHDYIAAHPEKDCSAIIPKPEYMREFLRRLDETPFYQWEKK